ncbi:hypothetical protein [Bradyrhizobium sp. cf659]|uniref:hypothetical protein n=1 Tax=Bradyrhizobium sp. cf659 TaxID=1761771 RepID=UPI003F8D3D50
MRTDRARVGIDEPEPEINARGLFGRSPERAEKHVEVAVQIENAVGEDAPRPGRRERPAAPVEEGDADRGFGTPDRLRDCGLRHPELAGRLEHAAGVGDSSDNLQASQVWNGWLHLDDLSRSHIGMQILFIP